MAYKNQAQERYFQYLESKGKIPKKKMPGDDMEPMHEGYAMGGRVDLSDDYDGGEYDDDFELPDNNFDYEVGHATDYDSSGEPHTEDESEADHPMEYMSRGGVVRKKKMNKGGLVARSNFAKALRQKY